MSYYEEEYEEEYEEQAQVPIRPEDILFRAKCIYPFESTCDVELHLNEGDIVNVTRDDVGGGWYEGEKNGEVGLFPSSYVEKIGAPAAAPPPAAVAAPAAAPAATPAAAKGKATPVAATPVAAAATPATPTKGATPAAAVASPQQQQQSSGKVNPVRPGNHVVRNGQRWAAEGQPFTVKVKANEEKGQKLGGLKKFTTYEISSSSSAVVVIRRFKHFEWLHERLEEQFPCFPVPPLPGKQMNGRFEDTFIEERRRMLERFLNRIAIHPILSASSVFHHFLTVTDQKEWKSGKRAAEAAEGSTKTFLGTIVADEELPIQSDAIVSKFTKFAQWWEKQINSLRSECEELSKVNQSKQDRLKKLGAELAKCADHTVANSTRPDYHAWWKDTQGPARSIEKTLDSLAVCGEGFASLAKCLGDVMRKDQETLYDTLQEYHLLCKTLPAITKAHDNAWHDCNQAAQKGVMSAQELADMKTRCIALTNLSLAEFRHFHERICVDFHTNMKKFINAQMDYHNNCSQVWAKLLFEFQ